ncbi:MAG: transposase [Candidatus Fermentithermobacillus carboniphilus]|uniref:Transposase n=1 Tax=Candidatus Fermentithermobacillus carboniphilus TaxID=3085328 RepID=A0AAT9LB90_9FIRM|nr:MAG: transposase [Candidatus Fermentithermobacillus carboniphilus]
MGIRKSNPSELKAKVVSEILKETKSISEISSEYGVHSRQLVRWKNEAARMVGVLSILLGPRRGCRRQEGAVEKHAQILQLPKHLLPIFPVTEDPKGSLWARFDGPRYVPQRSHTGLR